ncbi:MAG: hypothetical protein Q9159_004068 [Coniocarpon cinnabarinum]
MSPQAMHPHHRPPPAHVQPNGHPGYTVPQRLPASSTEMLAKVSEATWLAIGMQLLNIQPPTATHTRRSGHAAEHMKNHEMAFQAYERALHYNDVSVDALQSVANVLRAEDKYAEAAQYLDTIIKMDSANGEAWSSLGHCYLMMDELQRAYEAYQHALYKLHDPKEPKLWYGIGILYDRYGSLEHAEEAFSQVMRMAPDFEKANEIYFRLGIIYKQQNKFAESLECFRWIANNPPSPLNQTDILFQIGHVHEQEKDFESAKNAYQQVLDRDPNHAKVLQQLGWLYHQESNDFQTQERAIEFLEKSVASDQNDAQSWYLLGRCYMSQQKFPKAYEAYQQAVYRDGRNPTFWCSIGVLYYQINQYRDALDAYSRAIRLNPNISEVWYDLGTLYQSCNNQTNDAMDAYQRAAELDPNNPHIKSRLALLRSGHQGPPPGAPQGLPPDGHPQTYEPAALNGPPQPHWAPSIPPQSGPPPRVGAPPQPPSNSREWPRGPEVHGANVQPPPPNSVYEAPQHHRGPPPPPPGRPQSPRTEQLRPSDQVRYTPTSRPAHISPSPRMQSAPIYRQPGPPGPNLPSAPGSGVPPHAQPPPNRMNNPNYPAQPPPQGPPQQGPPPPSHYARPSSPPPPVSRHAESRPRSPRSYPGPPPPNWGYPPEHRGPAPGPMPSIPPAEAPRVIDTIGRERENRTPLSSSGSKRHREWEETDPAIKRPMNDETRARLEDPLGNRYHASPAPGAHIKAMSDGDREREKHQYATVHVGSNSANGSHVNSPSHLRRPEEDKRRADEYRPSEVAHHPSSMQNLMRKDSPVQNQSSTLPPINTSPIAPSGSNVIGNNGPLSGSTAGHGTHNGQNDASIRLEEGKQEDGRKESPRDKGLDRDGDTKMREEPAMRKIEEEDYEEDEEDRVKNVHEATKVASNGQKSADVSPTSAQVDGDGEKMDVK